MSVVRDRIQGWRESRKYTPVLCDDMAQSIIASRSKSVTLMELIVVITIIGIISVGLSQYITQAVNVWTFLSYRHEVVNQVRVGLVRMGRDIRQIKKRTPAEATIEESSVSALQFIKTADSVDTLMRYSFDGASNKVNYTIDEDDDDDLSDETPRVLLSGVDSFSFTYYTYGGAQTTDESLVYRVRIDVTLRSADETLQTHYEVFPRNLKY